MQKFQGQTADIPKGHFLCQKFGAMKLVTDYLSYQGGPFNLPRQM